MPNVVFDASALIGAALKRDSTPERALLLAAAIDTLAFSSATFGELASVLARPKFEALVSPARRNEFLRFLLALGKFYVPRQVVQECRDAKDNKYLELALECEALAIITSDNDLLSMDAFHGTKIVTPAQFLSLRSS